MCIRDRSWSEFAERSKTAKTIILPSGACEVYGPHNPLGADILVAKKMSEMLAERVNGIVGPCLEVGQSKSLTSFPGTIAISAETLKAVYSEIIAEFVRLGFKSFFIVNNHLHNTQPLNEVLEDARIKFGIKYAQVGVWQYMSLIHIFDSTPAAARARMINACRRFPNARKMIRVFCGKKIIPAARRAARTKAGAALIRV